MHEELEGERAPLHERAPRIRRTPKGAVARPAPPMRYGRLEIAPRLPTDQGKRRGSFFIIGEHHRSDVAAPEGNTSAHDAVCGDRRPIGPRREDARARLNANS